MAKRRFSTRGCELCPPTRRAVGRVLLLAAVVACLSRGAMADLSDFAVFGSNGIYAGVGTTVHGSMGTSTLDPLLGAVTVDDGSTIYGSITCSGGATIVGTARIHGNIVSGGDATLDSWSTVDGDVTVGHDVTLASWSTVGGNVTAGHVVDRKPNVTVGGLVLSPVPQDPVHQESLDGVDLPPSASGPLEPLTGSFLTELHQGGYQFVNDSFSSVTLFSGIYYFDYFMTNPDAWVYLDLSGGAITIYTEFAYLGSRTHIVVTNGLPQVSFESIGGLYSESNCILVGNINAPMGGVTLGPDSRLNGTVQAQSVTLLDRVEVGPGSDAAVPAPGAVVLGAMGLALVGCVIRGRKNGDAPRGRRLLLPDL
jgi:hypothetical protein